MSASFAVADLALKGMLVLAVAAVASAALRRAPASARHLAWALAFAGLLALPVLALALPAWRVPLLPPARTADNASPAATSRAPVAPAVPVDAAARTRPVAVEVRAPAPARESWPGGLGRLAMGVWMAGVAIAGLRLGIGLARAGWMERRARTLTGGAAVQVRDELVRTMGIGRTVTLLEGAAGDMPLTWGVVRPRILLPRGTDAWPAARLRAVLMHELAHVRRRDCAWQLVAEAACALHWFNPLAWAAGRRLRLESEHACDDLVLRGGVRGADYADHLLHVARGMAAPGPGALAAVPMARPGQLRTRVHAVLAANRPRGSVPRRTGALALAGTAMAVGCLASFTPRSAGAAVHALVTGRCAPGQGSHAEDLDLGRTWRVSWSNRAGCGGSARIVGGVRFSADSTAVTGMEDGALLRLELTAGDARTRAELRVRRGRMVRTFWTGGRDEAWGPRADAWLRAALPELLRHTTYLHEGMPPGPAPMPAPTPP